MAQVVVIAGPSGAGKSRLAQRLGWPVLRLDDFYREGTDPGLPRILEGPNAGLVDWDHPDSWDLDAAMAAVAELCREGRARVPVYELSRSARTGWHTVDLDGAEVFLAEGIFAPLVVAPCRDRGLLRAAYCVRQHPLLTFARRLHRDLREARKPPLVLIRRGWALRRAQRGIVDAAVAAGCTPATGDQAYEALRHA